MVDRKGRCVANIAEKCPSVQFDEFTFFFKSPAATIFEQSLLITHQYIGLKQLFYRRLSNFF